MVTDPGVREQMEALPTSQVLIGLAPTGSRSASTWTTTRRTSWSTASDGGTSTALRSLTAPLLHNGGHVLALDFKRTSRSWARVLSTVTYGRDIDDTHDALLGLRTELKRRIDQAEEHGDTEALPRLIVMHESADHTLRKLARHRDTVRQAGEAKTSSTVNASEELLFAGREARIHVLADAQSYSAALGREQLSTVLQGASPPARGARRRASRRPPPVVGPAAGCRVSAWWPSLSSRSPSVDTHWPLLR
ncbi:hypothetical protein [Streptomyces sp. NPDC026589]|uniref:hypothetical protein n=1 Tax=Streptomyces sp. NPDC026589 TaxID=3155609 RepID=UPI0033CCB7A6